MKSGMQKKFLLLIGLFLLFGGFIAFRFFMLDSQNAFGRIKIVASPSANVFIDSVASGHTPYEDKYKTGEFLLKLIPDGTATDTASWQGKIKVYKNALTYVNIELGSSDIGTAGEIFTTTKMTTPAKNDSYGETSVETEPAGAIVYLDNDEKGVAPLILADVMKGDHELSVSMPGFKKRTQKINIDAGYRVNATFKLAIDQNSQQRSTPASDLNQKAASGSATTTPNKKIMIVIKDTPLGYLRVREDASTTASESGRVKPGETYEMLEEKPDWFKIKIENKTGWVSAVYAQKQSQ